MRRRRRRLLIGLETSAPEARRGGADAPSAPKPGAVVRPTRRRVPGTGGFPDRLEASRRPLAGRGESLSRSYRAAAGTVSRATRFGLDADRGWRGRRPGSPPRKVAPRSRSPAGRREPARTRARPFPGRARLAGEAGPEARRGHRRARPVGGQGPVLELPVVEPGVEAAERPGRGSPRRRRRRVRRRRGPRGCGSTTPAPPAVLRWQTRRPPPAGAGSVVNRCGGGWSAVADAPSAPDRPAH